MFAVNSKEGNKLPQLYLSNRVREGTGSWKEKEKKKSFFNRVVNSLLFHLIGPTLIGMTTSEPIQLPGKCQALIGLSLDSETSHYKAECD